MEVLLLSVRLKHFVDLQQPHGLHKEVAAPSTYAVMGSQFEGLRRHPSKRGQIRWQP